MFRVVKLRFSTRKNRNRKKTKNIILQLGLSPCNRPALLQNWSHHWGSVPIDAKGEEAGGKKAR